MEKNYFVTEKINCSKCNKELNASYECDNENNIISVHSSDKLIRTSIGEISYIYCKCSNCNTENKIVFK